MNRGRALLGQAGEYADGNPARGAGHLHYMRIAFAGSSPRRAPAVGVYENDGEGDGAHALPGTAAQPAPGQAAYLTNQVVNARAAPVEAAWRDLDEAGRPRRPSRPGSRSAPSPRTSSAWTPDHADHPRHPDGHLQRRNHPGPRTERPLARASNKACALIRKALTVSGISRRVPRDGTGE